MGSGSWYVMACCGLFALGCSDSDDGGGATSSGNGSGASGGGVTTGGGTDSGGSSGGSSGANGGGNGESSGNDAVDTFGVYPTDTPAGSLASLRVVDAETGDAFDGLGRPEVDGGTALELVVGFNQFWFAWAAFNPESRVFNTDHTVAEHDLLQSDGECAVACDAHRSGGPPKGDGDQGIPALTDPPMVSVDDPAADYLTDDSIVVGVYRGGEAQAYPHNIFWWHEIVNDVVGGVPMAITHCPLTLSSITHDPTAFETGKVLELGVSGKLFNSNLVFFVRDQPNGAMYDSASVESVFPQLLGVATGTFADDGPFAPIVGSETIGDAAPRVPWSFEMTWAAWRSLFPDTTVVSESTGFARTYTVQGYPYGSYWVDGDTFGTQFVDDAYPEKAFTYGVQVDSGAKAYPHEELARWAASEYGDSAPPRGVVNDTVGDRKLAIVFDLEAGYVQAFDRTGKPDLILEP